MLISPNPGWQGIVQHTPVANCAAIRSLTRVRIDLYANGFANPFSSCLLNNSRRRPDGGNATILAVSGRPQVVLH
jgi:hypothetical protein